MVVSHRSGPFDFGDFLELVHEDQKADLIEGAIFMASPESLDHNDLVFWLGALLRSYLEERPLGRVTINKVAYRLSPRSAPEPDLGFVQTARLNLLKKGYVDGLPDVAVEIVSPESVHRDYEDKRRLYEQAGVREYWIIDPDETKATFSTRGTDGQFAEAVLEKQVFRSGVIAGFALDVRWLWQRPLPATRGIITTLLAQPPK